MTSFTSAGKLILALALCTLAVGFLSLMVGGGTLSSSTYAVAAALLIALAVVGFNTYRGGRATGSLGQLLYDTEMAKPVRRTAIAARAANRSDR